MTPPIRISMRPIQDVSNIVPVALPADLSPLVIRSGHAIAISTYPAGEDKPAVVHYIRLTRMDAAHEEEAKTE